MKQKVILECSQCGLRFAARIFTTVSVGRSRQTDDNIFDDEINYFTCERCDNGGFAWYPVKVIDRHTGERAIVLPTETEGFDVIEISGRRPCRVFYDFESLKWQIYKWHGGYKAVFDPPPREPDIREALDRGILREEEAAILRQTDWESMLARVDDENREVHWTDSENQAFDLYMKCMAELEQSRKIVSFKK
jgi:hypothetical protein